MTARVCPTCGGHGVLAPFAPDLADRGRQLRACIVGLGMTQQEFARRVGISQKHVSHLINGVSTGTQEMWEAIDRVIDEENRR